MNPHATYQDAELILRLYDIRREPKLRDARAWFAANFSASSFADLTAKYPPGSDHNAYFRMVASYWEMAASFVAKGIVHEELFFENNGELILVWEKIKHLVPEYRKMRSNPLLYGNLEKVATRHIQWMNSNAPGSYEAFAALFAPKK